MLHKQGYNDFENIELHPGDSQATLSRVNHTQTDHFNNVKENLNHHEACDQDDLEAQVIHTYYLYDWKTIGVNYYDTSNKQLRNCSKCFILKHHGKHSGVQSRQKEVNFWKYTDKLGIGRVLSVCGIHGAIPIQEWHRISNPLSERDGR